ncbi:MAG TPA: hypothetical protein QGG59_00815 [Planctomycetota bacterium]|nr:hypothetical protein [Planctomycetota bacterium]MDP7246269.1 hypothetical protein [Planctomycetota bacterium]HJM38632.1 hypothetical protein [Planctomycetota bacterium]
MEISATLALLGLEEALAKNLKGIKIQSLTLEMDHCQILCSAPMVGEVSLLADLQGNPGRLVFSKIAIEGGGFAKGLILSKVQSAITDLDFRYGPLHIFGESDGNRLQVHWDIP